jgi:hypothetical protein
MFTKRIFTMLGLLALATSMHAQDIVRVSVPFNFSVAGQALPTSRYEISRVSSLNPQLLLVRNLDDQSQAMLIQAKTDETAGQPKLVFDHYGEQYVLVGIVIQSGSYDLPHSKVEKRLSQNAAIHTGVSVEGQ